LLQKKSIKTVAIYSSAFLVKKAVKTCTVNNVITATVVEVIITVSQF